MRVAAVATVLVVLWVGSSSAAVRCGDDPGDHGDLLLVRLLIDVGCDCNGTRAAYMTCARQRIADAATGGNLRAECVRDARRCASRSRCGRPGRVTCCRTVRGEPRCKIRKSAAACTASGGTVGFCPSCCGACTNECFGATSTTTTTLPQGTCGDSAPECGGSCSAGQFCARDDDIELAQLGCRCFPAGVTPCMQGIFPACGTGACLGGEVCQAVSVSGDVNVSGCFCVPPTSTCGPFPGVCQGLGACPPGQICSSFVLGGSAECGCVTTTLPPTTTTSTTLPGTPCGSGAFPQCDGACPEGLACQGFRTVGPLFPLAFCNCVFVGSTCETPPGGGCATGLCPGDEVCTAFVVDGTVIDCGCGP